MKPLLGAPLEVRGLEGDRLVVEDELDQAEEMRVER